MSALAQRQTAHPVPSRARRPHLREVRRPEPRPRAGVVALYALGLVAGFLLAAIASVPGGSEVVGIQLTLALAAGTVAALAGMRARAVVRRRARAPR